MPRRCLVTTATEQMYLGQEPRALSGHRRRLVHRAAGQVLDLSSRWATNHVLYLPGQLEALSVLGPRSAAPLAARPRARSPLVEPRVLGGDIETFDVHADAYDTVVATMALCTVTDLDAVLVAVRRSLRAGGQLLVLEHVRGTGLTGLAQRVVSPLEEALGTGCRIDVPLTVALRRAGLDLSECARFSAWVGAGFATPCLAGVAHPRAARTVRTATPMEADAISGAP